MEKIFEKIEGLGILIDSWETHSRGKNYLASITGTDTKYKFKREFLNNKSCLDGDIYFPVSSFEGVLFLEIRNIYFSGSGRKSESEKSGYYQIEIREDGLYGERLSETDLTLKLSMGERTNPMDKYSDEELITELKRRGIVSL